MWQSQVNIDTLKAAEVAQSIWNRMQVFYTIFFLGNRIGCSLGGLGLSSESRSKTSLFEAWRKVSGSEIDWQEP